MTSTITVLIGDQPSTKHYNINPKTDQAQKGQVSTSYYHDSYTIEINNLADLYEVLESVRENSNAFVIRGKGTKNIQTRVRRTMDEPKNFYEAGSQWICLDFDEMEGNESPDNDQGNPHTIDHILHMIDSWLPEEFKNTAFIWQWSSSAGLEYKNEPIKKHFNCHLFFWLDKPVTNAEMKCWFTQAINKGFDSSTFNTVTPIFVGSHIVKDPRIIDTIPDNEKFGIYIPNKHSKMEVTVPEIVITEYEWDACHYKMPEDTISDIIQKLYEVGAIYKKSGSWLKLKHPLEKTKGDWHVKLSDPVVVHHHVKKSMRVDNWLKEFYHCETNFQFGFKPQNSFKTTNSIDMLKLDDYKLQQKIKGMM